MQLIGYVALVRLHRLAPMVYTTDPAFAKHVLPEKKPASAKRRLEYFGGRIAATLAAAAWHSASGKATAPLAWNDFEIGIGAREQRHCLIKKYGCCASVGISHSGRWAVAIASPNTAGVAIDIEDRISRPIVSGAFHRIELRSARSEQARREYWTLKETIGKLSGCGILGYENRIFVVPSGSRRWVGVPFAPGVNGPALLGFKTNAHFSIAIGMDLYARRNLWDWKPNV